MVKTFKLENLGYELEVGKFAKQAHGAAFLKKKGTVILATAVMAENKDFPGFLPLSVDYREQFSAAGRIPGGYLKREGKSSDREVLVSRLIDRAIRPLFPDFFFNQVQVLSTVYSFDKDALPATMSLLASSLSLVLSPIPFMEPVGAVEVGRIDGQWILEPTHDQTLLSDVTITVAGTKDGICMVEGSANGLTEDEFVEALFFAHERIKEQVAWQESIAKELGITKNSSYEGSFDWHGWKNKISSFMTQERMDHIFKLGYQKDLLEEQISTIKNDFMANYQDDIAALSSKSELDYLFDVILKETVAQQVVIRNTRVDGRSFTQVRPIVIETELLPSVHGSALFQRGQTQALVSATLGSGKDAQKIDDLIAEGVDYNFMLHYNFPPFSVGEAKPMRGPGRREVGHGYLAASAIKRVLPDKKDFPYTIRVISDILESNGSSSMATVCGGILALMDAGVPVKNMVGGVAMGLLEGEQGQFQALTDITGFEDSLGLMDFKVAGTTDRITAIQMDIKYKGGLPRYVFEKALAQANQGRNHILGEMQKVLSAPKAELSPLVPRIIAIEIDPSKAGAVIGSGGKIIKEIIEKTNTTIDIEGSFVNIFGFPTSSDIQSAVAWVKILAGQVEKGLRMTGIVAKATEFGLFVDIAPGKSGLLHISKIAKDKQKDMDKIYPVGSPLAVEILDYDAETGKIRLGFAPEAK
ncbi:polyribonucleotide nucleotidyltransferase [bacterium]|nr:polyribonucleotide nucleotidyltransferase [bacterium]